MSKPGTDTAYLDYIDAATGVAVVTLDHFPVNSLDGEVLNGLTRAVLEIEAKIKTGEVKGVVLRGAGPKAFCAGADISRFGKRGEEPVSSVSLGRESSDNFGFEELECPVVAAIHGFALGGGFELSLGCHYRVMHENATVGLPECNIGILPGFQGTQRLPRLIGPEAALQVMTTGNHVSSSKALKLGVVDEIVSSPSSPNDAVVAAAIRFAASKAASGAVHPRISAMPPPPAGGVDFAAWAAKLSQARPGEIAPHAILRCVEAACAGPSFPDGVLVEQREFQQLVASPESAALRHIFFAERAGKRVDGLPASVTPQPIRSVGIVGAGLMGGGIAMCCANVGIDVVLMDLDAKGLDRGMKLIAQAYKRSRSMAEEAKAAAMARIRPTTSYADFADVDMAVEAIFESMPAKVECFEALDAACKPGAFLCSNTSFLNIDTMAAACRPERQPLVMGAHFFSPANVMKLLENVRGARTSDVAIATMMDWGSRIGKWTILAGNCHGFIGNRMISFYTDAARAAVAEGAMPGDVDRCATAFGMRMGPLAMGDLVGLDVGIQAIKAAGEYDPKTNITHALLEAGRKGRKTGSGWFDYDQKGHGAPSPFVTDLLSKMYPPVPGKAPPTDEQITLSLFMPMVNEGFKILEEGFAQRPSDIDTCFVHGYSFPRVKGGPMHWADAVGLDRVKATLEELGIAPAALLIECVEKDVSLGTYWAKHGSEVQAKARERAATSRL